MKAAARWAFIIPYRPSLGEIAPVICHRLQFACRESKVAFLGRVDSLKPAARTKHLTLQVSRAQGKSSVRN
jgi:hypothetical protein